MALIIRETSFENDLERHAKQQSVPTTKGRLLRAIAKSAIAAADAEGTHVGRLIDELRARSAKAKRAG